jgi:hypothetical protein
MHGMNKDKLVGDNVMLCCFCQVITTYTKPLLSWL